MESRTPVKDGCRVCDFHVADQIPLD